MPFLPLIILIMFLLLLCVFVRDINELSITYVSQKYKRSALCKVKGYCLQILDIQMRHLYSNFMCLAAFTAAHASIDLSLICNTQTVWSGWLLKRVFKNCLWPHFTQFTYHTGVLRINCSKGQRSEHCRGFKPGFYSTFPPQKNHAIAD